jgi:hypothetical protein
MDITTVKELRDIRKTDIPQPSGVTNASGGERDQNNIDTPSGITVVKDFRDILPFHDRFLQQLGDRHRWVLYRVSFTQSPDQHFDTTCDMTWTKEYVPHEIARLDKTVYMLLQEVFQDFAPVPFSDATGSITRCLQVGHEKNNTV